MNGKLDLPAGPPTRPGATISFLQPLEELHEIRTEFREQDVEAMNIFFDGIPAVVPDDRKQMIKGVLLYSTFKARKDGERFTAMKRIDNPEAKSELCGRRLLSCERKLLF